MADNYENIITFQPNITKEQFIEMFNDRIFGWKEVDGKTYVIHSDRYGTPKNGVFHEDGYRVEIWSNPYELQMMEIVREHELTEKYFDVLHGLIRGYSEYTVEDRKILKELEKIIKERGYKSSYEILKAEYDSLPE